MKKLLMSIILTGCLVIACNMHDVNTTEQTSILSIDSCSLTPDETELVVFYHTDYEWRASVDSDWIDMPLSGERGLSEIRIRVGSNYSPGAEVRQCRIAFFKVDDLTEVRDQITVIQDCPRFSINETNFSWEWNDVSSKTILIETNLSLDIHGDVAGWVIEHKNGESLVTVTPKSKNTTDTIKKEQFWIVPNIVTEIQDVLKTEIVLFQDAFKFTLNGKEGDCYMDLRGDDFNTKEVVVDCKDSWIIESVSSELITVEKQEKAVIIKLTGTDVIQDGQEVRVVLKADCGVKRMIIVNLIGVPSPK